MTFSLNINGFVNLGTVLTVIMSYCHLNKPLYCHAFSRILKSTSYLSHKWRLTPISNEITNLGPNTKAYVGTIACFAQSLEFAIDHCHLCEHTLFLLHDVQDNRSLGGGVTKYCAKGKCTMCCKETFFFGGPGIKELGKCSSEKTFLKDLKKEFKSDFKLTSKKPN